MLNFILGIITGVNLYGIYQDMMGMERYIEWCRNNWQPAEKTLWTHIIIVLVCVLIIAWRKNNG